MKQLILLLFLLPAFGSFGQTAKEYREKSAAAAEKGNLKEAMKAIEKAIALDGEESEYYFFKGVLQQQMELYGESLESYRAAIKRKKTYAAAYNQLACLEESLGLINESFRDFDYAIKYAENDEILYAYIVNRASLYLRVRDFEKAYSEMMLAYAYDSTKVVTLNNLSRVCDELGKTDQALAYLFRLLELDSTFYGANTNIGFIYQKMGKHEEALLYFNKHLEHEPDDGVIYNNISYSKLQLNDIKGAMTAVEKAIKLYPENSYAYRNRALIYLAQEKNSQACEDLRTAIRKGFTEQYGPEVEELLKKHCL